MPVPDIAAAAAPADLSLSQSMSASASELKRPASAASSLDDSQTLSRTKAAKSHYARAARAFLAKDLPTALVQSQLAADLISASNQLGSSLTASSFLNDADLDVQKLVEKIAVLRLTVFTQVYTDQRTLASVTDALTQAKQKAGSDGAAMDRVALLLSKQPLSLISHLWFEALRLCSHTSSDADAPSLDPTPETIHLAIELPASVVSSAVLAALRLDALEPATRTGTNAARLIAEWYLASFSSAFGAAPPTPRAAAAYENIVGLYSLHVLASRLGEWEYAREFVGYSSLAESVKFGLLEQIGEAQAHLTAQTQREQDAIASAQKATPKKSTSVPRKTSRQSRRRRRRLPPTRPAKARARPPARHAISHRASATSCPARRTRALRIRLSRRRWRRARWRRQADRRIESEASRPRTFRRATVRASRALRRRRAPPFRLVRLAAPRARARRRRLPRVWRKRPSRHVGRCVDRARRARRTRATRAARRRHRTTRAGRCAKRRARHARPRRRASRTTPATLRRARTCLATSRATIARRARHRLGATPCVVGRRARRRCSRRSRPCLTGASRVSRARGSCRRSS